MLKKIIIAMSLFFGASAVFAGPADWDGVFTLKDAAGAISAVKHTQTRVYFSFLSASKCMQLYKGSKFNQFEIKENVSLCTEATVESFTQEVEKLGSIIDKSILLGTNYSS